MKSIDNFIIERGAAPNINIDNRKIITRYPHVNMIVTIINELKKHNDCKFDRDKNKWSGKDADLWEGAGQFLFDYMKELGQNEFKDIVNYFKWEEYISDLSNIDSSEISICMSQELQK